MNLRQTVFGFVKTVLLTSIVVTGAVVGLRELGTLESLELGAYDQMIRWRPDEGPDDRLLVVGVSETDIQTRKEYPIYDGTLAQLLEKLEQYQPRAIALDILRDVPQGTGREALIERLKASDRIIAVCKLSSTDQPGIAAAPGIPDEQVGFADFPVDPGGTLRRSLLLSVPQASKLPVPTQHVCNNSDAENQVLSLGFNLALLYLEAQKIQPELTSTGDMKLGSTLFQRLQSKAGGYHKVDTGSYQMMLNYRSGKNAVRQVTLTEVLDGKIDPNLVKDRIVFIGYTAPIVKDDFYTPYSAAATDNQKIPGVVIQAQNTSQILSAVLNNRPLIWYWSEWREILWIWGWSLLGGILAWRSHRLWIFGLSIVVAVGAVYGISYVIFLRSGWIPVVPAAIALIGTSIAFFFVKNAKTIYQNVKKIILDIEIDRGEIQKKVAEITETDSFAELQQKAKALRNNRQREGRKNNPNLDASESRAATPVNLAEELPEDGDYLQQLQQRGKSLKSQNNPDFGVIVENISSSLPRNTNGIGEVDFFDQFRKKNKQNSPIEPISMEPINVPTEPAQSFSQPVTPTNADAEEVDYLQQLQQKGKKLKTTKNK